MGHDVKELVTKDCDASAQKRLRYAFLLIYDLDKFSLLETWTWNTIGLLLGEFNGQEGGFFK